MTPNQILSTLHPLEKKFLMGERLTPEQRNFAINCLTQKYVITVKDIEYTSIGTEVKTLVEQETP